MRFGYAFIGVGLAIVKWPLLIQDAASLPVMDGVVTCLLTAMSLLAFLGLRYPVRVLPILQFEVAWKVLWIAVIAIPRLVADEHERRNPRGPVQLFLRRHHLRRHPVGIRREALRQDARERVALTSAPPSRATTTGTGYRCPPLRETSTATAEAGACRMPESGRSAALLAFAGRRGSARISAVTATPTIDEAVPGPPSLVRMWSDRASPVALGSVAVP